MTRDPSRRPRILAVAAALIGFAAASAGSAEVAHPHLRRQGEAVQLVVDGGPFLVLGGELGNSSASSLEYMEPHWPTLRRLHLNTVLAPVYWDRLEPEEGRFDFGLVDGLLAEARRNELRLVLLWFASWKNSMSCYAPAWVKTDLERFPRARRADGTPLEIVSPFSEAAEGADARAFGALMRHLREVDGERHTVLMVQVENEIGMIPEARDRSAAADARFAEAVPAALLAHLSRHRDALSPELAGAVGEAGEGGTWSEVFGDGAAAEEVFMAWHFGRYVETVTAAGKAEYPLPIAGPRGRGLAARRGADRGHGREPLPDRGHGRDRHLRAGGGRSAGRDPVGPRGAARRSRFGPGTLAERRPDAPGPPHPHPRRPRRGPALRAVPVPLAHPAAASPDSRLPVPYAPVDEDRRTRTRQVTHDH